MIDTPAQGEVDSFFSNLQCIFVISLYFDKQSFDKEIHLLRAKDWPVMDLQSEKFEKIVHDVFVAVIKNWVNEPFFDSHQQIC